MEWYHLTSTFASNEFLHFDKSIRDWVVIPMFILLIIVGMGRQYLSILIKNTPKVTAKELEKEFRQKQVIAYSSRLRSHGNSISNTSYQRKKLYLLHKENGLLQEKISTVPTSPLSNPNAMMDMMKGNLIFMIPNIAMMTFVSYFFSGFLCLKLPFQLPSNKFKLMLQRGIDIVDLDVTYVSALSWYFIVTFGLNGIYRMLMSDGMEMNDQAQMMNMQVRSSLYVLLHF